MLSQLAIFNSFLIISHLVYSLVISKGTFLIYVTLSLSLRNILLLVSNYSLNKLTKPWLWAIVSLYCFISWPSIQKHGKIEGSGYMRFKGASEWSMPQLIKEDPLLINVFALPEKDKMGLKEGRISFSSIIIHKHT